jgi:methylenetetrahydrofolate dehydrogenase (NADP+)/methenyltetrahydrofolate cyclohydrolase
LNTTVMDGRKVAQQIRTRIRDDVQTFEQKGVKPCLATILIGDDAASKIYLKIKHSNCREVGIESRDFQLPANTTESELIELIRKLNNDSSVHGILVQLPLPEGIDGYRVVESVSPEKDVDGLHPFNTGRISYRRYDLIPCTPKGIMALLNHYRVSVAGKHAVIINRSTLVGKPLYTLISRADPAQMLFLNTDMLLLNSDATVTICHSKTQDLMNYTREADILITAVGNRLDFMIRGEMIKPGAVVVDAGISKIDGKIYGDVNLESVIGRASYVTPVPGGVGPMTVAMLLHNTLIAAGKQTGVETRYDINGLWTRDEEP